MTTIPTMLSIESTAKRTGLPAHFIRQLILTQKIVHVRAGNKYLVNLERLIEYLNDGDHEQRPERGEIRRVAN